MKKTKFQEIQGKAIWIIQSFPKSKNGQHYLTLRNGKKLFFSLFLSKYGLDGSATKYDNQDIIRRIRLVEFFDYFTKQFALKRGEGSRLILESHFHRMVIIQTGKQGHKKLELLSFYPY